MDFGDFTITKREIFVAITITLILVGLGFIISGAIENGINENNEKYFKALKIDNDEEMFRYAIKTNVGYTLAQGRVKAVDGVSIDDILGKYLKIKKVKEEYTKHTRQVAHTRTVSDGNGGTRTETYYTTEEYWTWDFAGQEEFHTQKFNFLGVDFDYGVINFYNESHKETKNESYYIRYQYYIIPFEFDGTLFTFIENNTISKNDFSTNKTIDKIIEEKESSVNAFVGIFWFIWIMFIIFIDFGYVYLDNNYLED